MKHLLTLLLSLLAGSPLLLAQAPYLTVLGIAQDAGYPQAACRKACCQPVWQGEREGALVSCLALVDPASGRYWLFDATPSLREQLQLMEGQGELAGILLTHAHIGHYTGLMQLGREAMGADGIPVYTMPRMKIFLETNGPWSQLVALENITLQPLAADSTVSLAAGLHVIPIPVPHRDEYSETVGYLIKGPERQVLYLPDIDKWHLWERGILDLLREVDIAFLDGTFFANGEIPGRDMSEIPHPFMEESMALFGQLPEDVRARVHFIHFNHTNPVLNPEGQAARQVLRQGFRLAAQGQRVMLSGH